MTRYRWVAARKAEGSPTTIACEAPGVSVSAFNDWRRRQEAGPTVAELEEARLVAEIRAIWAETDGTCGEPRITPELAARGFRVNHKRTERLMRVHGIVGVFKPAKVKTTIPAEDAPPLPDLVGRRFKVGEPDFCWVGDITYIPTGEGGCISRRCSTSDRDAGWDMRWPTTCAPRRGSCCWPAGSGSGRRSPTG